MFKEDQLRISLKVQFCKEVEKHRGKRGNCSIKNCFSFCHNVFKSRLLQRCQKDVHICGKAIKGMSVSIVHQSAIYEISFANVALFCPMEFPLIQRDYWEIL